MGTERVFLTVLFLLVFSAACIVPNSSQHNADFIAGAVAMTMQARSAEKTASAMQAPPIISVTLTPTATLQPEPEDNPDPCYQALLIGESVPDGTILETGEAFAKSWILRNTGSCTWTPDYRLIFSSGDQMDGPDSVKLNEYVAPGDHTEILVQLTAPSHEGTHIGYWRMKANNGVRFARIYVEIEVEEDPVTDPTPTRTTVPPAPVCGNFAQETGETCDDGNTTDGDGCDATCQTEPAAPVCGNFAQETGETCDDGNTTDGDGCDATCQTEPAAPVCGNFAQETGETCDDGNTTDGDGCSATCQTEPAAPVCGNFAQETGETCDDGNTTDGDGCSAICQAEL